MMAILAVLFNPFVSLHFAADTWKTVDWISAVIMGISLKCHIGKTDFEQHVAKSQESQQMPSATRDLDCKPQMEQELPDYELYMADLQVLLTSWWHPPKSVCSKNTVVLFKVHQNGQLSSLRIKTSSGTSDVDNAAVEAVRSSAPFPTLPPGSPENLDIEFAFAYNVYDGVSSGKIAKDAASIHGSIRQPQISR